MKKYIAITLIMLFSFSFTANADVVKKTSKPCQECDTTSDSDSDISWWDVISFRWIGVLL